jgi:hypothetical protein
MSNPGERYRTLATRCRESAANLASGAERAALLQMAVRFDRRASEVEADSKAKIPTPDFTS